MTNLIEQIEDATGTRWDDPDNPAALYSLLGAVAREMGKNPHGPRDDYAVGLSIAFQVEAGLSREAARKRAADQMVVDMLMGGVLFDTLGALLNEYRPERPWLCDEHRRLTRQIDEIIIDAPEREPSRQCGLGM